MKERESDEDEEIKEIVHGSKENETCEFSTTPVQKLDMESFRKERKKKKTMTKGKHTKWNRDDFMHQKGSNKKKVSKNKVKKLTMLFLKLWDSN